jgi:hypothetical protein
MGTVGFTGCAAVRELVANVSRSSVSSARKSVAIALPAFATKTSTA